MTNSRFEIYVPFHPCWNEDKMKISYFYRIAKQLNHSLIPFHDIITDKIENV